MKKFKASLAALLAVCSLLGLAGCSERNEQSPNEGNSRNSSSVTESSQTSQSTQSAQSSASAPESSDISSTDTSSGSSESTSDSEPEQTWKEPEKIAQNNMENSIKVFDAAINGQKNAMFSPLSLNMALGLVQAGAKGETKKQIDSFLNTEDYADFAGKYLEYVDTYLTNEGGEYEWGGKTSANILEIANSFWAGKDLPLKEDYKKALSEKLGAEIENVDFSNSEETLKKINGWVNEKTHEMIPSILDSCDESMKAALINTVYFEADWSISQWEIDENKLEDFTNLDGLVTKLPLMKTYGDYYFENDNATAFSRYYRNGMEFIGILPKENGDFSLESLDIPSLLESRFKSDEKYLYVIHAAMPRLNFESKFDLNSALEAAGIGDLFDESKSDLSGASDSPLMITSVMQKTKLELDEYGTKAAAVTAFEGGGGGGDVEIVEKDVFLNRPFAFLIYDSYQNQIVFMGKVTNVEK